MIFLTWRPEKRSQPPVRLRLFTSLYGSSRSLVQQGLATPEQGYCPYQALWSLDNVGVGSSQRSSVRAMWCIPACRPSIAAFISCQRIFSEETNRLFSTCYRGGAEGINSDSQLRKCSTRHVVIGSRFARDTRALT